MEILFYIICIIILSFGAYQAYIIRKKSGNTTNSMEAIQSLVFKTVNDVYELYKAEQLGKDVFIEKVISEIRENIISCDFLSQVEKDFWTEEKISLFCKPTIIIVMNKLDTLKK